MKKLCILLAFMITLGFVQPPIVVAQGLEAAYDPILLVKAAYLIKLVDLLKSPKKSSIPSYICLSSKDKIYPTLMHVYSSNPIFNQKIQINALSSPIKNHKIESCHIFYFSGDLGWEKERLNQMLNQHSVVSISDTDNHIMNGGMIGFVKQGGKIRLELNMSRMRLLGISVNPKLIEISPRVI